MIDGIKRILYYIKLNENRFKELRDGMYKYIKTPSDKGYNTDDYGNLKHKSNSNEDYLKIKKYSGNNVIQIGYENGNISSVGQIISDGVLIILDAEPVLLPDVTPDNIYWLNPSSKEVKKYSSTAGWEHSFSIECTSEDYDEKYAKKDLYDDTMINIGRKTGSEKGENSTAFGTENIASGNCSAAIGELNNSTGHHSIAIGIGNTSSGDYAISMGMGNESSGHYSYSEGVGCNASGGGSKRTGGAHAEGHSTTASGTVGAHAEGYKTTASGDNGAHAEGYGTIATGTSQHVQGKYNVEDTEGKYAHIIGNGTSHTERSNAHTVDWDGNAWYAGDVINGNKVSLGGLQDAIDILMGITTNNANYVENFNSNENADNAPMGIRKGQIVTGYPPRFNEWVMYHTYYYDSNQEYGWQIAFNMNGNGIAYRYKRNYTWNEWVYLVTQT